MNIKNLQSIRSRADMIIYLKQEIKREIDQFKNDIQDLELRNQSAEWVDYQRKEYETKILEHQTLLSKADEFQKNSNPLGILIYRRLDLKGESELATSSYIWKDLACFKNNRFPLHSYNMKKTADFEFSYDMHGTTITEHYKIVAEF
ncbi:MAG: hypothetical protein JNL11_13315 [Bdellovibrionaceae bacterium]|nr:hypothetical protein [Pseudobdellovibrionaceae bacterium]